MGLGSQIVNLVGANLAQNTTQAGPVGQVAVVQEELPLLTMLVKMVDAARIELRSAAHDTVNLVALAQQELGEIGTILTGNSGDQGSARGSI